MLAGRLHKRVTHTHSEPVFVVLESLGEWVVLDLEAGHLTRDRLHDYQYTVDTTKKVKFSHTRYRALGPELIPVYRQSARR